MMACLKKTLGDGLRRPFLSPSFAKRWCKCRARPRRKPVIFCNCEGKSGFFPIFATFFTRGLCSFGFSSFLCSR